ncbi:hypothetical protein pb186bvf_016094 [Paramecium bursaria]
MNLLYESNQNLFILNLSSIVQTIPICLFFQHFLYFKEQNNSVIKQQQKCDDKENTHYPKQKRKFKIDILIIYPMGCKIGNTVEKNDISLLASQQTRSLNKMITAIHESTETKAMVQKYKEQFPDDQVDITGFQSTIFEVKQVDDHISIVSIGSSHNTVHKILSTFGDRQQTPEKAFHKFGKKKRVQMKDLEKQF